MFERYPEYSNLIRQALRQAPEGKLDAIGLIRSSGIKGDVLHHVITQMEQEGSLLSEWENFGPVRVFVYMLPPESKVR